MDFPQIGNCEEFIYVIGNQCQDSNSQSVDNESTP